MPDARNLHTSPLSGFAPLGALAAAMRRTDAPAVRAVLGWAAVIAALDVMGLAVLAALLGALGVADADGGGAGGLAAVASRVLGGVGLSGSLTVLVLALVVVQVGRAGARSRELRLTARLQSRLAAALGTQVVAAVFGRPYAAVTADRQAMVRQLATRAVTEAEVAAMMVLRLVVDGMAIVVAVAVAIRLSVAGTLVAAAAAALLWGATRPLRRRADALSERAWASQTAREVAISDVLDGLKAVRALRAEGPALRLVQRAAEAVGVVADADAVTRARVQTVWSVGAALVLAVVVWLGAGPMRLPAATLLLLLAVFSRLVPQVTSWQHTAMTLRACGPALQALFAYVGAASPVEAGDAASPASSAAPPFASPAQPTQPSSAASPASRASPSPLGVRCDGLTVCYPGRDAPTLRALSLDVAPGAFVAITGPSGVGKTTLLDTMLGLHLPTAGTVRLIAPDGTAVAPPGAAGDIGYLSQEPFLFAGSVAENVGWGLEAVSDAAVAQALRAADAAFVFALPAGVHTPVGERGVRLSGGERQRVALARALIRHPRLLLLDEATSALDDAAERAVLRTLRALAGRVTIVIASHRPAVADAADQVLRLGTVETGDAAGDATGDAAVGR